MKTMTTSPSAHPTALGQPVVPGPTLPVPKMPAAAPMPVGGGQDRIYLSSAGTGFAAAPPNERNRVSDTAFPIAW